MTSRTCMSQILPQSRPGTPSGLRVHGGPCGEARRMAHDRRWQAAGRPREPAAAGPALHPWLVVLALAPGIMLTLADATVMTITVQAIIRQVGGSVVSVSWVMNGYNLVLTVLFLPMGRLGDRYGHKLVFTLGLALFTAASLPCALATSIPDAGRLARGAGGRRRGRRAHGARPAPAGVPRAPPGLRRRPVRGRQLARPRGRPGARRRARLVPGLAGGVLAQPPGRDPRRRPRAHAHAEACARRAPARPSTGPASASSAPASSASRWRSSRATTGAGPRPPSSVSSPAAPPCSSSGCGGSCALPLPCSTSASSATAPSPRRPPPS